MIITSYEPFLAFLVAYKQVLMTDEVEGTNLYAFTDSELVYIKLNAKKAHTSLLKELKKHII